MEDVMGKFVFAYSGGSTPDSPAAQEAVMAAWMSWFGELGEAVVDGGAPFGPSKSITGKGAASDGAPSKLTGYSIISADDLAGAAKKASGCPILKDGGTVEIYEAMPM
jgi:hypothetical protein